ncbi:MAG: helix-turn-helix domain-containing protein [Heliobacteriaceae bacterium]|nr:helix-turn-helix domain-containing protein [Heliobacteriaceae bacterium]
MQQNDKELLREFGNHIQALRKAKGLSLNKFIFNEGFIATSTQSRIENGVGDFKFTTLVKLANSLGITLPELFANFDFKYEPDD